MKRNFYQQVTDIYATATDYDPRDEMTKMFLPPCKKKPIMPFTKIRQRKLSIIVWIMRSRLVGMTNFKGNYVTKDDVKIAKNYLSEIELQRLNLLCFRFLDFAEFQGIGNESHDHERLIEALIIRLLPINERF